MAYRLVSHLLSTCLDGLLELLGTYNVASKIGRHVVSSIRSQGLAKGPTGAFRELTKWRAVLQAT